MDVKKAAKISLCVIAKDEARVLPRLLRSVRGAVDEIIVVDTGSTDDTAAIAKSFGARVLHAPFQDDFSAVRNVSLAAATQPWILVLDADEVLAAGSGQVLRAAAADGRLAGAYLRFENDLGGGRAHVCGLMRFFRNDPSIRFEYVIHEQALPSIAAYARKHGLKIARLDRVRVYHDGYLAERRDERRKDERNERLFRKQLERHPDHAYSWYKFGDFLRRFPARRAEGVAALERAETLLRSMDDAEARDLSFPTEVYALLALEQDRLGRGDDALITAERGRARFGDSANLVYVLGHLYVKLRRWRDAFVAYARLRAFDGVVTAIPPEPGVTGPVAMAGLGVSLRGMRRPVAARRCFELAVALDPKRAQSRVLLGELLAETGDAAGAVRELRAALELEPTRGAARVRLAGLLLTQRDFEAAYLALSTPHGDSDCVAGKAVLEAIANGTPVPSDARAAPWAKLLSAALRPAPSKT